jgi:hypothetical protein
MRSDDEIRVDLTYLEVPGANPHTGQFQRLARDVPDLLDRAVAAERNARLKVEEAEIRTGLVQRECDRLNVALAEAERQLAAVREGTRGAALIAAERRRQISVEGWTAEHDDEHGGDALWMAACCYHRHGGESRPPKFPFWPWAAEWWKPKDRPRNLVRAGALYLAAIETYTRTGVTSWAVPNTWVQPKIDGCNRAIDEITREIDEWLIFRAALSSEGGEWDGPTLRALREAGLDPELHGGLHGTVTLLIGLWREAKPTECEAKRWAVVFDAINAMQHRAEQIVAWVNANGGEARYEPATGALSNFGGRDFPRIVVRTINGWAYAKPGDHIVMGSAWFDVPWTKASASGAIHLREFRVEEQV